MEKVGQLSTEQCMYAYARHYDIVGSSLELSMHVFARFCNSKISRNHDIVEKTWDKKRLKMSSASEMNPYISVDMEDGAITN